MGLLWWRIRKKLTSKNWGISDALVSSDRIGIYDDEVEKKIAGFEFDEERIESFRKKHASTILDIKRLTERSDARSAEKLNEDAKANLNAYIRDLKKQINDIQRIIELSEKIIKNEYLSILYDVRKPLKNVEHYKKTLLKNLKKIYIPDDNIRTEIANILNDINQEYDLIIKQTIEHCTQYRDITLDNLKGTGGLIETCQARARIKRQLGGRYQAVFIHIVKLENYFKSIKWKLNLSQEDEKLLIKNITDFKEEFGKLRGIIDDRTNSSELLIKGHIKLQEKKLEELKDLEDEIKKLAPHLSKDYTAALNNCSRIIRSVENEDLQLLTEGQRVGALTRNGLVGDESRIHSEGPVSKDQVGSNTILDKLRRHALKISFILITAIAAPTAVGFVNAVRADKDDKVVLVGSEEFIQNYVEKEGATISADKIQSETTLIVDYEKVFSVNDTAKFNFSVHYDNSEGITDSARFYNHLYDQIQKDVNDSILSAKQQVLNKLRGTNFSKQDKDKIFDESANITVEFIPGQSSVTGTTCPSGEGNGPWRTSTNNNNPLSEKRAKEGYSIVINVVDSLQKTMQLINFDKDSLSKINVIGGGAIYKHSKVAEVTNTLNSYIKSANQNDMNRFFNEPLYQQFSKYNNKDLLKINYDKLKDKDQEEALKFNLALRIMKFIEEGKGSTKYATQVKARMDELRRVEVKLTFKIIIKVVGSKDIILIPILPVADTPVRPPLPVPPWQENNKKPYVPQTIGQVNRGYTGERGKSGRTESQINGRMAYGSRKFMRPTNYRGSEQRGKQHKSR
ncbi:MAG: hypothetical protein ACP5N3_03695 [Candidatus Nanoarchaeia archaeon]